MDESLCYLQEVRGEDPWQGIYVDSCCTDVHILHLFSFLACMEKFGTFVWAERGAEVDSLSRCSTTL